jgi:hypothetical protein
MRSKATPSWLAIVGMGVLACAGSVLLAQSVAGASGAADSTSTEAEASEGVGEGQAGEGQTGDAGSAESVSGDGTDGGEGGDGGASSPLSFQLHDVWLEFEGEFESRRVRYRGRRNWFEQRNTDLLFEESVGVEFTGFLLDPNLLDISGSFAAGLSQSRFEESIGGWGDTESDTGYLLEFDISLEALRTKPLSFSAYARRADERLPRRFLPSLEEETTELGFAALLSTESLTVDAGLTWRDTTRTGHRDYYDDEDLSQLRFYTDADWEIREGQHLRFAYDYEDEHSVYQGSDFSFDTQRHELRLEHEYAFGPQDRHQWDVFFRLHEEEGSYARDEWEAGSFLRLEHSDRFSTSYRYNFYRYRVDGTNIDQHKYDIGAVWRPSDPWRFSLDGYALHEQIDGDVRTDEYGGIAEAAWEKPTRWGTLYANASAAYDRAQTRGDTSRRFVRDEAHSLDEVRSTFLRERNVIAASVLAHDATRSRIYLPGEDYLLYRVADRLAVVRNPLGRIAEDEVVYFDYVYATAFRRTVDTLRTGFDVEHAFEFGLTPYYYYEGRCEDVEDTSWSLYREPDNMHRHRFGTRYEQPGWRVEGEFEIFDDSFEPFDAVHLMGSWSAVQDLDHQLDLTADVSRYWFTGGIDERDVWWIDLDLTDHWRLSPFVSLDASLGYRYEDDSIAGVTNGVDVAGGLIYARNYLSVELTVEYDLLSLPDSREDGVGVFLNVRRSLAHLLPERRREE